MHTDKEVWGADADAFVADRFRGNIPYMSFRGFGNGASACCGKTFVLYNLACFIAILAMKYDMMPVDGAWKEPGQDGRDTTAQVAKPKHKTMVRMTAREDLARGSWEFNY